MRSFLLIAFGAIKLVSAASWSFEDASIAVSEGKGAELGSKKQFAPSKPLSDQIILTPTGSLRVGLTVTNGGKPRKPHQAFLTISNEASKLEESFALTVNDNGKAKFDLSQSKIPLALLQSQSLQASVILGGFGSSKPLKSEAFTIQIQADKPVTLPEVIRYGKLPEIHHIFRTDTPSPPKALTLLFTAAVVAALPVLLITWLVLGANLNQLPKAFAAAPISHILFFSSIVSMEGLFYLYYTSWNLFQILPVAGALGLVTIISASGALTEVQERRLKGER